MELPGKLMARFIVGAILMLLISFTLYGKIQANYDQDKKSKKNKTLKILLSLFMIGAILGFIVLFDCIALHKQPPLGLSEVIGINIFLLFLLSLFDAIFIDLVLLVYWKPKFLNIPKDSPMLEYMKKHLKAQFTIGLLPIVLIATLGAVVFFFIIQ